MGLLVDGKWQDKWYDTESTGGRFEREESQFRDWISADGATGFRAEPGRYHLYVSYACPWASRALIVRALKRLESVIDVSVVHWHMGEAGWEFRPGPGCTGDRLHGLSKLYELYQKARPDFTGRVTVPALWDTQTQTIVSNESAEIIRMFNSEFDEWGDAKLDLYPVALQTNIDAINEKVYHNVNNGVYKAGFATTQAAYEEACDALFQTLDELEQLLADGGYLLGETMTEADWRLFTTLIRFDPVYHGHFKCNKRRIVDYPALARYTRRLYEIEGVADTVDFHHIKHHYYGSHKTINPTGIVPAGPEKLVP